MADFITLWAVAIFALSPLLRRLYIERFWAHGRGTVIRLEGGINTNPGPGGGTWVWTPVIEYHVAGKRLSSRFSYWQSFNARSKYAVGDEVDILYSPQNPSRFILDSWDSWISYIIITIFIAIAISSAVVPRSPGRSHCGLGLRTAHSAATIRSPVMIVDAQVHLWLANTPERPWLPNRVAQLPEPFLIEQLVPMMDEAGVDVP